MSVSKPFILSAAAVVLAGASIAACGGDEERPPPIGGQPGTSGGAASGGAGGAGGATGGSGAVSAANCGTGVCIGEGKRCINSDQGGQCQCIEGYIPDPNSDDLECIVDKSCVKLRFLEDFCRVVRGGPPAVGLFFAVDYCAGTAVLPDELGDPATAFKVLEDGGDTTSESAVTFLERDVESYVMVALDVSASILDNPDLLQQVTAELEDFVTTLEASSQDVTVGLLGFGRRTALIVPFTKNTAEVTQALEDIRANPRTALEPAFQTVEFGEVVPANYDGTVLMPAVDRAIRETERIQSFRRVVTQDGVLTSGTVVVVTDGEDSNGDPVPSRVQSTRVNVISIGISDEVTFETLAGIGRDGSFLAPNSEARTEAFDKIAKRVEEHPDRAYMLAYCSAKTQGNHEVSIELVGRTNQQSATCDFDADVLGFSACDVAAFDTVCDGLECGGFFACGACGDDQCCTQGTCMGPAPNDACNGQDELCGMTGNVCTQVPDSADPVVYECTPPLATLDACGAERRCGPGQSYCDGEQDKACLPAVLEYGDPCMTVAGAALPASHCQTQNCTRRNDSQPFLCGAGKARLGEPCGGPLGNAACEGGATCKSNSCALKGPNGLFNCSSSADCASGYCGPDKFCYSAGFCQYTWSDKLEGRW